MSRYLFFVFILSSFLFVSSEAAAAAKSARPCLTSDLIGSWEMRNIKTKVKLKEDDAFGWPQQRMVFDRRGDVKQVMSQVALENDPATLKKFNNTAFTSSFVVNDRGILAITKIESPVPETCLCSFIITGVSAEVIAKIPEAKRNELPKPGDIVLTYLTQKGQPIVVKTFRKI